MFIPELSGNICTEDFSPSRRGKHCGELWVRIHMKSSQRADIRYLATKQVIPPNAICIGCYFGLNALRKSVRAFARMLLK